MALFAMVAPILPGKTEQWHRFADELRGPRFRDYSASRRRLGIRERVFFQSTPLGDLAIVTLEGDDPVHSLMNFASGNDEFTRWFVQQVKEIHGLDLGKLPESQLPKMSLDTQASGMSQM